ncbi:MAG TPA: hypothetical protein VIH46_08555 [Candidatus Acidoferrales bacterium]
MSAPGHKSARSPRQQLDSFLAKFTPERESFARRALGRMRKRLPNAIEMVYDNYNALVIGFVPNLRPSDAIFSLVLFPRKLALCFLQGAKLPDPHKRLKGSGNVVRNITIDDLSLLDDPQIRALMEDALRRAKVPMDPNQKRKLIIRSISAKQRPRRPA